MHVRGGGFCVPKIHGLLVMPGVCPVAPRPLVAGRA